ncbi:hypothetical protein K491DRAFT_679124 [Lophiostoma macrostomum CBS 122681]|uniref:BTB domain-containing protein n=1 Tax=Lophiostoma macrostomum CBS 122681 TaxID=1314788 RepID=A0A6A6T9B2_9PLEO|nr:hypothetical protein K491DRAFT_679124 [Lophiostoma macrostomum CBS 122681]
MWVRPNNLVFKKMPKRALLAFSSEMQKALSSHAMTPALCFNDEQVPAFALYKLCDFMKGNCKATFALKPGKTFEETVDIYRVACLFDMGKYAGNLKFQIRAKLMGEILPSYSELEAIMKLPPSDGLFKCAAMIMSSYRHQGGSKDKKFLDWLLQSPELKKAMDEYSKKKQVEKENRKSERQAHMIANEFPGLPQAKAISAEESQSGPKIASFKAIGLPVSQTDIVAEEPLKKV